MKAAAPSLERLIAATCLHPRLRSLLLFDSTPARLHRIAEGMRLMLQDHLGAPVSVLTANTDLDDDGLWGLGWSRSNGRARIEPPDEAGDHRRIVARRTTLWPDSAKRDWLIVLVKDLTRIAPPLVRSAYQLMGTDTACLERYGYSAHIVNRTIWLAGCPRAAAARIPLHLRDRLTVQTDDPAPAADRPTLIRAALAGAEPTADESLVFAQALPAPGPLPPWSDQATKRLHDYCTGRSGESMHRDLAMARLATALAALDRATEVAPEHIDEAIAADALSGSDATRGPGQPPPSPSHRNQASPSPPSKDSRPDTTPAGDTTAKTGPEGQTPGRVKAERPRETLEIPALPGLIGPGAATVPSGPGAMAFPMPSRRTTARHQSHGEVLGARSARPGDPIAMFPTLLAAAPWQARRHASRPDRGDRLLIDWSDLRTWRRAERVGNPLILLLDLTAVRECLWVPAVAQALQDAYQSRSPVSLILVGAQSQGPAEWRAERIPCRTILVPQLRDGLDRAPGRATPLAHGLQLALDDLAARPPPRERTRTAARLVILTDGRGNVPLATSQTGAWSGPVGRRGIDDALETARRLSALDRARIRLLSPQPRFGLPILDALAAALGVDAIEFLPPVRTGAPT